MTPRQHRFVGEYLACGNATKAAVAAGYSPRTARVTGSKLLTKVDIAEAVARGQERAQKKAQITLDDLARELAKIAFANMGDYLIIERGRPRIAWANLTPDQTAAISQFIVNENGRRRQTTFRLSDKQAALVNLARILGLSKEKTTVETGASLEEILARMGQLRQRSTAEGDHAARTMGRLSGLV